MSNNFFFMGVSLYFLKIIMNLEYDLNSHWKKTEEVAHIRYMAVSQKVQELFSDLRHIGNIYCLNNNAR